MSRPTPPTYRTRNWPAYNEARKRRGSLTIWFDPEMSWDGAPTGRRGRQQTYSGEEDQKTVRGTVFPTNAIQTCLTMKALFGMALLSASATGIEVFRLDCIFPYQSMLYEKFTKSAQSSGSENIGPERPILAVSHRRR